MATSSPHRPASAPLTSLLDGSPIQRRFVEYRQSYGNYVTGLPPTQPGTAPPVVVDRAFPPLSLSTYRGLTVAAAWIIGVPTLISVIFGIISLLNPLPFSDPGAAGFIVLLPFVLPTLTVIAPAFFGADIGRHPAIRWISSTFYVLVALSLFSFNSFIVIMTSGIPELRAVAVTISVFYTILIVLAAAVAVVPFLPDSNAFMRRLALFTQTVNRVDSGQLTLAEARAQALPPISVPREPLSPPRAMNGFAVVFTFVCILNLAQYPLLPSLMQSMSATASARIGIDVGYTPIAPVIIFSLIALCVWIFAAVRTRAGSQVARVFLTIMFIGAALYNLAFLVSPESLFIVDGFVDLLDIPGWYRAVSILTAVIILICSTLMLYFLYRPESNKYFVGMHYLRTATPQDGRDLEQALAARAHQRQAATAPGYGAPPAPGQPAGSPGWNNQNWNDQGSNNQGSNNQGSNNQRWDNSNGWH